MKNKHFKNQLWITLASIFAMVSVFSIGFATWVYTESSSIATGTITVDVGDIKTVDFGSSVKLLNDTVRFDSKRDDHEGNVTNGSDTDESLSIKLEGTVYNYSDCGEVTVSLSTDHDSGLKSLVSKGYIVSPVFTQLTRESSMVSDPKTVGSYWTSDVDNNHGQDKRDFLFYASFQWGPFFRYMNPGEFFDSSYHNDEKAGRDYSSSEVKSILDEIKDSIDGAKYKLTLGAKPYQYEVTLLSNGGHFEDGSREKILNNITYNDFIVFPSVHKDGNKYTGWKKNNSTDSKIYTNRVKASDVAEEDSKKLSFSAQWNLKSYTISYDSNGGSSTSPEGASFNYGASFTFPKSTVYTAPSADKVFSCWSIKGKEGLSFSESSTILLNENFIPGISELDALTVIPIWKDRLYISVKFDSNGGTGTDQSQRVEYGSSITLPDWDSYSKDGQMIYGWKVKGDATGLLYDCNSEVYISNGLILGLDEIKEVTFVAQWQSNVVTIEYTYGTEQPHSEEANYGDVYTLKSNADVNVGTSLTKFDGWLVYIGENQVGDTVAAGKTITLKEENLSGIIKAMHVKLVAHESCILPASQILMADGSYKKAKDIKPGDSVLIFNHETGELEVTSIFYNFHYERKECIVTHLKFSDGTVVDISGDHGFFDLNENKYVYLNNRNSYSYIGHDFIRTDGKVLSSVKLINVETKAITTDLYCPVSTYHLNYFVEGLLSLPGGIDGCFNFFDYDDNLKYDSEDYEKSITKFGLLRYEEVQDYIPQQVFDSLPMKYMKVAIGKGLLTMETLQGYMKHFYSLMK